MSSIARDLVDKFTFIGTVHWIGIRPKRDEPVIPVAEVMATAEKGLIGDHYSGKSGGKRQVTLIQLEHLEIVGKILRQGPLMPELTRRNIVVSGLNLQSLRDREFQIGDALLQGTGLCHPCSKMEATIGPGGYAAMLGHGGLTATVLRDGVIRLSDSVLLLD